MTATSPSAIHVMNHVQLAMGLKAPIAYHAVTAII